MKLQTKKDIEKENKIKLYMAIILMIVSSILCCFDLSANDKKEEQAVIVAVRHMLFRGLDGYGIRPCPNHFMVKDDKRIGEFARAVVLASQHDKAPLPVMFLVAMAYREGSFKNDAIGDLEERSTFQIVEQARRRFNCDLSTYDGSARCSATILRAWMKRCGSLKGALAFYATGRTCELDTKHLKWMWRDRSGIAKRLSEIVGLDIEM